MQKQAAVLQKIAPYSADVLDPFYLRNTLSIQQKIKVILLSVTLLPIRLVLMSFVLLICSIISFVGLKGFPEDELTCRKPLSGWRRHAKTVLVFLGRLLFAIGGWHWIPTKGERASPKEAPILVVVPHTTFWDTVPVYALGAPSIVVRDATASLPVFGNLLKYTQSVLVRRDDPRSRQSTAEEICRRCSSNDSWGQVLIFPEGTCGNRQALLDFKLGAFYPGVPVQPVFIRYKNKLDSLTWTWDGPGTWRQILLTLCQLHIFCELEFLPVYYPTAAEKEDPRLYAENCRRKISSTCNIPMSYFSLDDVKHLMTVKTRNLPKTVPLVKLIKLRAKTGKEKLDVKVELTLLSEKLHRMAETVCNLEDFAKYIECDLSESLKDFFRFMDQEKTGKIDVRVYNVGLWLLKTNTSEWKRLENSFKVFDPKGEITSSEFASIAFLWRGLPSSVANDVFFVLNFESKEKNTISFKTFKSVASTYLQLEQQNGNGPRNKNGSVKDKSLHHQKIL